MARNAVSQEDVPAGCFTHQSARTGNTLAIAPALVQYCALARKYELAPTSLTATVPPP
jgi:hypothetical protein